jgi:DNA polymerase III alpha subunit
LGNKHREEHKVKAQEGKVTGLFVPEQYSAHSGKTSFKAQDNCSMDGRRVYQGNAERYGELGDCELGRIDYELKIIEEKGFSFYFLTIDDIVRMASSTCGRGSGAAFIVSYGLGITMWIHCGTACILSGFLTLPGLIRLIWTLILREMSGMS